MSDRAAVSSLGSILGVWAHPDDETFMVGGLLYMAAQAGQQIACVTATRGEAGVQNDVRWPAATLGETRDKELAAALEILGITEHQSLGYSDGQCKDVDTVEATAKIATFIDHYQPNSIITFAPDGLTGHDDHRAISRWVSLAVEKSAHKPTIYYAVHTQELFDNSFRALHNRLNIYFNIEQPVLIPAADCDLLINLSDLPLEKKLAALKIMPSQYDSFFAACSDDEIATAFGTEALIVAR